MDMNNKLTILSLIHDNKDILFGRFSEKLTHYMKIKKWKEIAAQLNPLEIFTKDWKYLRDTTWQNWRKRTIEKKDNRNQTGSGGGKRFKFDDIDDMVLKIIGKDSPVIEGLNMPESSGSNDSEIKLPTTDISTPRTPLPHEIEPPINRPRKNSQRFSVCETEISEELQDLKRQKIKLDLELAAEKLEIAKRERRKLDLEILKLERELNIQQPSNFTLPFYNVILVNSDPEHSKLTQAILHWHKTLPNLVHLLSLYSRNDHHSYLQMLLHFVLEHPTESVNRQ